MLKSHRKKIILFLFLSILRFPERCEKVKNEIYSFCVAEKIDRLDEPIEGTSNNLYSEFNTLWNLEEPYKDPKLQEIPPSSFINTGIEQIPMVPQTTMGNTALTYNYTMSLLSNEPNSSFDSLYDFEMNPSYMQNNMGSLFHQMENTTTFTATPINTNTDTSTTRTTTNNIKINDVSSSTCLSLSNNYKTIGSTNIESFAGHMSTENSCSLISEQENPINNVDLPLHQNLETIIQLIENLKDDTLSKIYWMYLEYILNGFSNNTGEFTLQNNEYMYVESKDNMFISEYCSRQNLGSEGNNVANSIYQTTPITSYNKSTDVRLPLLTSLLKGTDSPLAISKQVNEAINADSEWDNSLHRIFVLLNNEQEKLIDKDKQVFLHGVETGLLLSNLILHSTKSKNIEDKRKEDAIVFLQKYIKSLRKSTEPLQKNEKSLEENTESLQKKEEYVDCNPCSSSMLYTKNQRINEEKKNSSLGELNLIKQEEDEVPKKKRMKKENDMNKEDAGLSEKKPTESTKQSLERKVSKELSMKKEESKTNVQEKTVEEYEYFCLSEDSKNFLLKFPHMTPNDTIANFSLFMNIINEIADVTGLNNETTKINFMEIIELWVKLLQEKHMKKKRIDKKRKPCAKLLNTFDFVLSDTKDHYIRIHECKNILDLLRSELFYFQSIFIWDLFVSNEFNLDLSYMIKQLKKKWHCIEDISSNTSFEVLKFMSSRSFFSKIFFSPTQKNMEFSLDLMKYLLYLPFENTSDTYNHTKININLFSKIFNDLDKNIKFYRKICLRLMYRRSQQLLETFERKKRVLDKHIQELTIDLNAELEKSFKTLKVLLKNNTNAALFFLLNYGSLMIKSYFIKKKDQNHHINGLQKFIELVVCCFLFLKKEFGENYSYKVKKYIENLYDEKKKLLYIVIQYGNVKLIGSILNRSKTIKEGIDEIMKTNLDLDPSNCSDETRNTLNQQFNKLKKLNEFICGLLILLESKTEYILKLTSAYDKINLSKQKMIPLRNYYLIISQGKTLDDKQENECVEILKHVVSIYRELFNDYQKQGNYTDQTENTDDTKGIAEKNT